MSTLTYTSNGLEAYYNDSRFSNLKGQNLSVAIIDTGIDLDNPWFGPDANNDKVADKIIRRDLDFASSDGTSQDIRGHGTAVAGVISAIAPNAKLIPLQVASNNGSILTTDVNEALDWVSNNSKQYNIKGVNLSLSDAKNWQKNDDSVFIDKTTPKELKELTASGVTITASAGNYYDYYDKPGMGNYAAHYTSLGAMATNSDGIKDSSNLAGWSQRRSDGLAAPGQNIKTATLNQASGIWAGTSFASPFILGASMLVQNVAKQYMGRYLTTEELATTLKNTSIGVGNSGYKEIDVFAAAESIYNRVMPPKKNIVTIDLNNLSLYATNRAEISADKSYASIRSSTDTLMKLQPDSAVMTTTSYDIERDTLLSFEYRNNAIPQSWDNIIGIGTDNNSIFAKYTKNTGTPTEKFFSLSNEAVNSLNIDYDYKLGSNTWQKFEIPLGDYLQGSLNLTFYNDFGNAEFKNVQLT